MGRQSRGRSWMTAAALASSVASCAAPHVTPTVTPWQAPLSAQNPFVGTRPYQGLLVILLRFNSSDLKNTNNTLYEVRDGDAIGHWYVVRDLGAALGETARLMPIRGNPQLLAREPLVAGVRDGFVEFN